MVAVLEKRRCVSIGIAAAMLGVAPQTLRDWEARGLIPAPERVEGPDLRFYDIEAVERIRRMREGQTEHGAIIAS